MCGMWLWPMKHTRFTRSKMPAILSRFLMSDGDDVLARGHPRAAVRVHHVAVLDDLLHGPEEVPEIVVLGPLELRRS